MDVPVVPTLIDQFRETFEGAVTPDMCWITDGRPESALFGTVEQLTPDQAFASPAPGGKSIAAHVAHLRYTLDLTCERMRGADPPADWASSFNVGDSSPAGWDTLKRELRRAYESLLSLLQQSRAKAVQDLPPIHVVGLAAMIAHNAYHLGAIRQMSRVVVR